MVLDLKLDKIWGIEATVPNKSDEKSNALILRACNFSVFGKNKIWSEVEMLCFDVLNHNNNFGMMDIEFVFQNNVVEEAYPEFYTKCFVLRTDTGKFIKPMKRSNYPNCSKINQNGELVVGVRYFFHDEHDIDKIKKCNEMLIEMFVALGKQTNVFALKCDLVKTKDNWEITSAYTCKPKYARNVKRLYD